MKKVIFIALCLLGISLADATQLIPAGVTDSCELRGWIAFDAITKKNAGKTLKEVKADFYNWLTVERTPELPPGPSNLVIGWYNDWGPEDIQDWFKRTYVETDPKVAYDKEVAACKITEDPPAFKPDRKL